MSKTYKDSGVDIDAGDRFVDIIAPAAKSTYRPEVLSGVGPFAACFSANFKNYKNPVIVAATDGVGTKLKIAIETGRYDTIGQDLVAMCVNDLICCGAEPLFFLDYFAMGVLKPEAHAPIIEGIAKACKASGCSLIGGETAEMPGMYHGSDFDLAGFSVGVVDRNKIVDGGNIKDGDVIIGIASSGVHSNGYSLVRNIIQGLPWDHKIENKRLVDLVLEPTKLYPKLILSLLTGEHGIKGIAHITGGGLDGNVPRVIPKSYKVIINTNSWPRPTIFKFLQERGNVSENEMRRVFNLGIGMVLITDLKVKDSLLKKISDFGEKAWVIGNIEKQKSGDSEISFT